MNVKIVFLLVGILHDKIAFGKTLSENEETNVTQPTNVSSSNREERLLFKIIRISPEQCVVGSSQGSYGTCMSNTECKNLGGVGDGKCARGFGVCCLIKRSCNSETNYNNTHFMNPNYPSPDVGHGACTVTINRVADDICQIRFDFIDLELSQPDVNGICDTDFLTVTGGVIATPTICGENSGQHIYVNVEPNGGAVGLSVDRTAGSMSTRRWNVKVAQIACTSTSRAPPSCLQYFIETSGTIQSFNFNQNIPATQTEATRQLANLDYGVCIKAASGYCGINWSRNITGGQYGFTVSKAVNAHQPDLIGTISTATFGAAECTEDYVIIPGGVLDTGAMADRFCGLGFPTKVSTTAQPFMMFVKTNGDEANDALNRGFSLDYRQTICK